MGLEIALTCTSTTVRRRFDTATSALVGSRCDGCGAVAWPGRAVCHRCGSAGVSESVFGGPAQLLSYTEVMVPRPGLDVPYVLGQVRLQGGPIVFGRVVGLEEPVSLPELVETRVGGAPAARLGYWFESTGARERS